MNVSSIFDVTAVPSEAPCPVCGHARLFPFYSVDAVPVHSVLRLPTHAQAVRIATGAIRLSACAHCGFITNEAFDEQLMDYSGEYDGTQAFSPTFNAFHEQLAADFIRRYDLHDKDVVEIGCGNGEFLTLLCERGDNRGLGFDPAYTGPLAPTDRLRFVPDVYNAETLAGRPADFVCCKMTLEHIAQPAVFVGQVRHALGPRPDTTVVFQVPDVTRVLQENAFWDIYHEHCSYFSSPSLQYLFEDQGFDVQRVWTAYDDQYLMIETRPGSAAPLTPAPPDVDVLLQHVARFAREVRPRQAAWQRALRSWHHQGQRVVLWGGGSKAVAFLTTLGVQNEVHGAVDINPGKQGSFLAGTGLPIIGPNALTADPPDVVIVMNPIYRNEIRSMLSDYQLSPYLLTVNDVPDATLHARTA